VVAIKALPLVKGLSEKKIERFKTEAKANGADQASERRPTSYDVRTRPELIFIVMEFIDGETLMKKLERERAAPRPRGP